jgi:NAD(P)-dependent dehydrogenase (short-subunit alcohol dehydrogenase family)
MTIPTLRLDGKTALVTGASSGLGRRFAEVLADAGAAVALCARRTDRLEDLARAIRAAGGRAEPIAMDVADTASIRAAVAEAERRMGPIGILVNNSGVGGEGRLMDVDEEVFDQTFGVNVRGAFFVAQAVARRMAETGGGRIVNIASVAGLKPIGGIGVYSMSKAAVVMMTRAMATEWARRGIDVNAICPGYISTEINERHWETEGGRKLIERLPRRRLGRPEDLDALLLLLCSDAGGFVNGAVVSADDGMAAG